MLISIFTDYSEQIPRVLRILALYLKMITLLFVLSLAYYYINVSALHIY